MEGDLCKDPGTKQVLNRYPSKAKYILRAAVRSRAIPLQGWTGPEVFRKLRLPDFKTIRT
jgi:hypothetical protein